MFLLEYRFAVPDVLYEEELRVHHPEAIRLGLDRIEVQAGGVAYIERIAAEATRRGISRND